MYTGAVQWFAAAHLIPQASRTRGEQVSGQDAQRWMVWLLGRYSDSCASDQYRALQQFFRWWAEEELPDPMARLHSPKVTVELSELERACQGRSFAQRRDAAIIAVFQVTGIRLPELAGIRCDAEDTQRSDLGLCRREMTARGKSGRARVVRIGYQTAGSLDRYIRARARHAQAWRKHLWLGEQPGADDSERHLPDDRPAGQPMRGGRVPAPVPSSFQSHLARPGRRRG
jgi:site-specific recombinase XerD